MNKIRQHTLLLLIIFCSTIKANDTLHLTRDEAVAMALTQSPQAIAAHHRYRAAYWSWRTHRANYLPAVSLSTNSSLNRSIGSVTLPDGSDVFVSRNQLYNEGSLAITQNIAPLGGTLFVQSGLQRLDLFTEKSIAYNATPLSVGYQQSLFGHNHLKWNKKLEPVRYALAKKQYAETMELIAAAATQRFYNLARAQSNAISAQLNYAAADTLFQYAQGRYALGTITENEMLQLEINFLTEENNRLDFAIELDSYLQDFRSFLGIHSPIDILVHPEMEVPEFIIPLDVALQLARDNSSDFESLRLQKIAGESDLAYAKASRGLRADLYMQLGLTQTDNRLTGAYTHPLDHQQIRVGIQIPLLDWGVGRGRVEVAKNRLAQTKIDIEQAESDFDANITKLVKQFNLQAGKVSTAQKRAERAQRRNEVAYRLYLLGKSTVLDLNTATAEKDSSQRAYLSEISQFWTMYYTIRSMTGWDFEKGKSLYHDLKEIF